jgi:hypothetical protein
VEDDTVAEPVIKWETELILTFTDKIKFKLAHTKIPFYLKNFDSQPRLEATFDTDPTYDDIGNRVMSRIKLLNSLPKSFSFTFSWRMTGKGLIALYDAVCIDGERVVPGFVDIAHNVNALKPFKTAIEEKSTNASGKDKQALNLAKKVISRGGITHQKMHIKKYEKNWNEVEITFKTEVAIYRCETIEYCQVLPRPPYDGIDKIKDYYVIEDNIEAGQQFPAYQLLVEVSDVARKNDQVVLVQGSPGSGKDVAAELISRLSLMDHTKLHKRSVGGYSAEDLWGMLFGKVVDGDYLAGLIDKAQEGLIFLDEFDKVGEKAEEFYASLLRVLESKEYLPVKGKSVQKYKNVRWVFAGAFTQKRMEKLPPDFFSRLTDHITIKNPLHEQGEDGKETKNIAKKYFTNLFYYFYLKAICDELKVIPAEIVDSKYQSYGCQFARKLLGLAPDSPPITIGRVGRVTALSLSNKLLEHARSVIDQNRRNRCLTTRAIIKSTAAMVSKARDIVVTTGVFPDRDNNQRKFNEIVKSGENILRQIVENSEIREEDM